MARTKYLNILKTVAKTAFTVVLVYLVFQKIDLVTVSRTIGRGNPAWFILALLLYLFSQGISSWRLYGLLKKMGLPLQFWFNVRLYLLGMFYNVFLPGGIGGDGYKLYLLHRKFGTPVKSLLMAFLFDRASGLWAITILGAIAVFFLPVLGITPGWPAAYIIAAALAFYLAWRILLRSYASYFPKAISRALVVQSIQCVAMACILTGLKAEGNYLPYIFSFLVSTIATVLPVSVGGLGLREYVMVRLAPILFLDEATAVSASFCFYILSTMAALPGLWFVYRSKEFTSRAELEKEKEVIDAGKTTEPV
ncbi:MAG: flippase-like domain-containing protein [Chitinophagaceae bacterium]|nr:MAG: flippase-like domain-containing protein [Chitinophagaceae bacterium]